MKKDTLIGPDVAKICNSQLIDFYYSQLLTLLCIRTYHIVNILPVIEGDQLERGQHGPHEIIEARVAVVRILADAQARVAYKKILSHWEDYAVDCLSVLYIPVGQCRAPVRLPHKSGTSFAS